MEAYRCVEANQLFIQAINQTKEVSQALNKNDHLCLPFLVSVFSSFQAVKAILTSNEKIKRIQCKALCVFCVETI